MTQLRHFRANRWLLIATGSALTLGLCGQAGCGENTTNKEGDASPAPEAPLGLDASFETPPTSDASLPAVGSLVVEPANATIDVTIVDGVVTASPVRFTAKGDGSAVGASWSLDRGELGQIGVGSGEFLASGFLSGVGRVIARYQNVEASATVTVRIHAVQNGKPASAGADAGSGGLGGVGGEGLGTSVDAATVARLRGAKTPPASSAEFSWLYPYDKTVWPRGLLPPLLQWRTTRAANAVYIRLKQAHYEFEGFYGGSSLVRQPIDAAAWRQATYGNTGDPLTVEVTLQETSNGQVSIVGPITETWTVAPGVLKGTVYYNSYNTKLANPIPYDGGVPPPAAAILSIRPGEASPTLAIPSAKNRCVVCHTVSHDGATMFAEEQFTESQTAAYDGVALDLKNNATATQTLSGPASTSDGVPNVAKFRWLAPYPDGSFAMTSSYPAATVSRLIRRDGLALTATGWDGIVERAATPSFSPDGKRLAFSYWKAATGNAGGNGHTLDVVDFACTPQTSPAPNAPSCSAFAFSNVRRLYTNPDNTNGFVGWPSWLPHGAGLVFHNTVMPGNNQGVLIDGEQYATQLGAKAQVWFTDVPASGAGTPVRMNALNGLDANGQRYIPADVFDPAGPEAPIDNTQLNYEPTMNPIASGGYSWVVFTSRRMYGNVAAGDPYDGGNGSYPVRKKLWVAAIDLNAPPGQDPSHPAFYLPGQELHAGNLRGFWVADPCRGNGSSCESGAECCTGYCRAASSSQALTCTDKPATGCAQEYERCSKSDDCCGANLGVACINNRCAAAGPK